MGEGGLASVAGRGGTLGPTGALEEVEAEDEEEIEADDEDICPRLEKKQKVQ